MNGYSGNQPPGWKLQEIAYADAEGKAAVRRDLGRWLKKRGVPSGDVQFIAD